MKRKIDAPGDAEHTTQDHAGTPSESGAPPGGDAAPPVAEGQGAPDRMGPARGKKPPATPPTRQSGRGKAKAGAVTAERGTRSLRAIVAQNTMTPIGRSLPEVKLSGDPARILLFSDEIEDARMHYEQDESVRSYFHCPGDKCPYCLLDKKLDHFHLLAVFAIASREVSVLRISAQEGPNRLLSLLRPHLDDPNIDRKVLAVSRAGYRYIVDALPVRPGVDVGANAIARFLDAYAAGHVKLASTFPSFGVAELREVPSIRNELDVLDGTDSDPREPFGTRKGTPAGKQSKGKSKGSTPKGTPRPDNKRDR